MSCNIPWAQGFRKLNLLRLSIALVSSLLLGTNTLIAFRGTGIHPSHLAFEESDILKRQGHSNHTSNAIKLPPYTPQESFGACALVLNQNHRITEWIAYHYFALPMRTLIIAYDPKSTQRATQLLHRWRTVMDIVEWEEDDYLPANWSEGIARQKFWAKPVESVIYENRQIYFMQQCTLAMAAKNVSRVIHHDVDEYLRIQTKVVRGFDTTRPGHITAFLNQKNISDVVPGWSHNASCWVFHRHLFTPMREDSSTERQSIHKAIDFPWLRPVHLDTLRYRYRNARIQQTGKGILQLNHIPSTILFRRVNFFDKWLKVHNPLGRSLCQGPWPSSPLILNHYTGSYEAYLYAAQWDPRFQDRAEWERRTAAGKGVPRLEDGITNWVAAFVAWLSEPVARMLLSDAGWRDEWNLRQDA
ncbi:hypothetical protein FisN_2Hh334 [Fistulifera solaris]|uniref:Uncharacterized protein n=1 Tax=Fistulifera solaris TaxID=1519565 RepID=A0A1Z5KKA8_FISSO|nr:hypothetical protein FisN_2Hh334 [Fistulifera solaris]|eukprot:GAX26719.1 hypothetical protein FisN_2Hh334 [Fistulifera solaris]